MQNALFWRRGADIIRRHSSNLSPSCDTFSFRNRSSHKISLTWSFNWLLNTSRSLVNDLGLEDRSSPASMSASPRQSSFCSSATSSQSGLLATVCSESIEVSTSMTSEAAAVLLSVVDAVPDPEDPAWGCFLRNRRAEVVVGEEEADEDVVVPEIFANWSVWALVLEFELFCCWSRNNCLSSSHFFDSSASKFWERNTFFSYFSIREKIEFLREIAPGDSRAHGRQRCENSRPIGLDRQDVREPP